MPLPTAAELTDPNVTNVQMKERLGQLVENIDRSYSSLIEANADISNIPVGAIINIIAGDDLGCYEKKQNDSAFLTKISDDLIDQLNKRIDLKNISVYEFAIHDKKGNIGLAIRKNGAAEIPKILSNNIESSNLSTEFFNAETSNISGLLTEKKNIGAYSQVWVDSLGNIALGILKDGSVYAPKLKTNELNQERSTKNLSIVESDTIMHIGDSMTANYYCVQDKSYVSQLSQLSQFRHINYGVTSTDLLEMQSRIIDDLSVFDASLRSMKPRYLFIASYVNDRNYANVNLAYYQENLRRLIDVALAHGVQPVLYGYFVLNSTIHQAVKSIADEYQIPVVWGDVLNKQIGFYDEKTLFHEWHVGTRTNGLFFLPMFEYIKQQKAMRTIKIYRKRAIFNVVSDSDLLFKDVIDKSKKWKEITVGHFSLLNEYKYDEINTLTEEDIVFRDNKDEYALLADKQEISFSDYALIEMSFDAYQQHLQSIEISLTTNGSNQLFVRDNLDAASALARGLPSDAEYQAKWNKPRGAWRSVSSVNGTVLIGKEQLIHSMVGNKLYLMIKGNFTLSDISAKYSATKYESHLPTLNKQRENLGPELLVQPLLGNSGQLSEWVTSGTVETLTPIDLAKSPRKPDLNVPVDGVVTLTSLNHVQQTISFTSSEEVRTLKVVAWARYFPKAYLDRTNPAYSGYDASQVIDRSVAGAIAPINKDTFDAQEISLETWVGNHPANNGAFQKDFVSLMWRPVTFYVEVLPYETNLSIRLSATAGSVQLAKVSIKEVI